MRGIQFNTVIVLHIMIEGNLSPSFWEDISYQPTRFGPTWHSRYRFLDRLTFQFTALLKGPDRQVREKSTSSNSVAGTRPKSMMQVIYLPDKSKAQF